MIRNSLILLCCMSFLNISMMGQKSFVQTILYDNGLIKEYVTYTTEYKNYDKTPVKNGQYISYYITSKTNFSILGKNQELLKKETGQYKYGLRDGYWVEYFPPKIITDKVTPGPIKSEGNYLGCNKIGRWKYYDEKGIMTEKEHNLSLKFPPDFYPCEFNYRISEYLQQIVKYSIKSDCSIDSIEYITQKGQGYDEAALFRSINHEFLKEFYTIKFDTSSTGQVSMEQVLLFDKNTCKSRTIIDTVRYTVTIGK